MIYVILSSRSLTHTRALGRVLSIASACDGPPPLATSVLFNVNGVARSFCFDACSSLLYSSFSFPT